MVIIHIKNLLFTVLQLDNMKVPFDGLGLGQVQNAVHRSQVHVSGTLLIQGRIQGEGAGGAHAPSPPR